MVYSRHDLPILKLAYAFVCAILIILVKVLYPSFCDILLYGWCIIDGCNVDRQLGLYARKPVFGGLRITQAQTSLRIPRPAHPRSLISAFLISFSERIICKLATCEISIFLLVCVAEETALKLALSQTPKTGFLATWAR